MKEALALDAKNGNNLWADTKADERENVRVAFMILPDRTRAPLGYQFV